MSHQSAQTVRALADDIVRAQTRLFDALTDGVFAVDERGLVLYANPAGSALLGYGAGELPGQPWAGLGEQGLSPDPPPPARAIQSPGCSRAGQWTGPWTARCKDGSPLALHAKVVQVELAGRTCSLWMTEAFAPPREAPWRRSQERLAAEHAVAILLSESASLSDAAPGVVRAIKRSLGASVGALWLADPLRAKLVPDVIVCARESPATQRFVADCRSRTFSRGQGLPGRTWELGQPAWLPDIAGDNNFPRAPSASAAGLRAGAAFPIRIGPEFFGVVEFFSEQPLTPDPSLTAMMAAVGAQVGQFIQRKKAEAALVESERRKSAILESALDCIITMDDRGRIVEFNPAAERTFGFTRDHAVGRTVAETIIPPALRDSHRRGLERFAQSGAGPILGRRVEITALRADGAEIPVELAITPTPLPGGRQMFTAYLRDITERKRAGQAIERSEARFRLALSSGAIVVYEQDAALRYTWVYPRDPALPEHLLGRTDADVLPHGQSEPLVEFKRRVLQTGVPERRKVRVTLPGGPRWYDVMCEARRDGAGAIIGVGGAALDITEQEEAQELIRRHQQDLERLVGERTSELEASQQQLRLAERMAALGTLSAGIGHDLANLLLPVRVRLESMARRPLPDDLRDDVEAIAKAAGYLQSLAGGLRLLAQDPERDTGADAVDLAAWWPEVEGLVRTVLPGNVRLVASIPAGLAAPRLPRAAITQILFNLLQNAGQALADRAGGRIRVWAEEAPGPSIRLGVSDNGPGMTEEVKRRCLEPFFTTKPRGFSTGLGLALVHATVARYGGTLSLDTAPGRGAAFLITLPALARERRATPARTAAISAADARQRSLLSAVLGAMGLRVLPRPPAATDDVRLWVLHQGAAPPADVLRFIAADPDRRAVVIGGAPADWNHPQVSTISADSDPEAVRRLLRAAAG